MPRTQYGVSPWIESFPKKRRPDFPRWRGSETTPVVIVGGGLAGCMTAYAFAASGVKVVLLEADRVGKRGAGRGPGILQGEAAPSYRAVEARYGRRVARALFDATRRAVLDLATTAGRLGIKNGASVHDALRVLAGYGAEDKALAKDVSARREAGLEAVWLQSSAAVRESGIDAARAGVRLHEWGHADPYLLVTAFAAAATTRGARVFERSAVRRINVRRKDVEVLSAGGALVANTVIICTGEPTDLHRSLKRHVRLEDRYVVMTDRLPASVRRQIDPTRVITDLDTPAHLIRWTDEGRLIVAGGDQLRPPARVKDAVRVQRTGQLMYELSRLYPAISGISPLFGWDVPMATTSDSVMYAGPHRNYPRHLFAWATRHDPSHAWLASRILLRHYLGEADRGDAYFGFTRG